MDRSDAVYTFCTGLDRYMERCNLKLKDVAEIMGITKSAASIMRSGKSLPTFDKVFALVEHGMLFEEIFGEELVKKNMAKRPPSELPEQLKIEDDRTINPNSASKIIMQGLIRILDDLNKNA